MRTLWSKASRSHEHDLLEQACRHLLTWAEEVSDAELIIERVDHFVETHDQAFSSLEAPVHWLWARAGGQLVKAKILHAVVAYQEPVFLARG